ncbi:MAG: ACP S-malonyltransferase [Synergistaceae bacterium]
MRYAIIFPGQGAQRPGMGKEFFDNYASAREVFEMADDALGFSLTDMIFNGTPDDLAKTSITQPSILTVSIAAFKALQEEFGTDLTPICMAGHSLGEYTSLVASGVLSIADGVKLVHLRGDLMQEAVPFGLGTMAAIVGLPYEEVDSICKQVSQNEVCQAANINSSTQVVISGHTTAVERAIKIIEQNGNIRIVPLRVSAPFHSDLMRPVAEKLKDAFEKIEWNDSKIPIIANATALPVESKNDIKRALYLQTFSPVLWAQSVEAMEHKVEGYIELGPGSVLSGLVRKISKIHKPYPVSSTEELVKAVSFLREEC